MSGSVRINISVLLQHPEGVAASAPLQLTFPSTVSAVHVEAQARDIRELISRALAPILGAPLAESESAGAGFNGVS